jgi:signal transduction histidine kinase
VIRPPTRHGGLLAGAALVVAATWVPAVTALLAQWPSSGATIGVVAVVATATVAVALAVARRWPRARDVRAAIADRVLVGAVTAIVATALFAGIVLALGGRPSTSATDAVRACLVAAAVAGLLLGPAVRRIVAWSRRIVYGSEGPRHELLDQFAHGLTRATALDEVLVQLVETVRPACAADAAEVWLQRDDALVLAQSRPVQRAEAVPLDPTRRAVIARAGVSGDGWAASWLPELRRGDDHLRVAPLAVQGELLGVLVARRGGGADDFDDADDEGLARVVRLVAAALQNAELDAELRRTVDELRRSNADLRASRARIVTVADDERRRLERDLHDGAQSHLMGIAVKVQLARALVAADPTDPTGASEVLTEIDHDVTTANAQLRSLAHGIFPPLLLTGGLGDALPGVAAHASIHVEVGEVTADRFDRQIEAAVYFCCAEAVQNAAKHAGSDAHVTIDVRVDDGTLTLAVHDDGPGFDAATAVAGHGLTNMADRLGALGGTLTVRANGTGTTVTGTVPTTPPPQRDSSVR